MKKSAAKKALAPERKKAGWTDDRKSTRFTAASKKEIPCLCCRSGFMSEGKHNRICGYCQNSEGWKMGNAGDFGNGSIVGESLILSRRV